MEEDTYEVYDPINNKMHTVVRGEDWRVTLTLTDEEREYIKACATAKVGTVLICRHCKTPMILERGIGWLHEDGEKEQICRPTIEQSIEWRRKVYLWEMENY
jgi:hypothetical protein